MYQLAGEFANVQQQGKVLVRPRRVLKPGAQGLSWSRERHRSRNLLKKIREDSREYWSRPLFRFGGKRKKSSWVPGPEGGSNPACACHREKKEGSWVGQGWGSVKELGGKKNILGGLQKGSKNGWKQAICTQYVRENATWKSARRGSAEAYEPTDDWQNPGTLVLENEGRSLNVGGRGEGGPE